MLEAAEEAAVESVAEVAAGEPEGRTSGDPYVCIGGHLRGQVA